MFIDPKMQVPVEDLVKGMIVQSGNDATMALAEGVGGTKEHFVEMMNAQAKVLGMKATSYKNPEGLTEAGHTTSARDLSVLATRLMADFPQYVGFYAIKKYRYPGTPAANDSNRNLLLFRDPTVDGLKTGHTDAAGFCMVATARRDFPALVSPGAPAGSPAATGSRRLLSIVLGTDSENARANESQKLLNWGYTAFEAVKLFEAGQAVVTASVWKGTSREVKVGQSQAIVVAVPQGGTAKIKTQVLRSEPLLAPVALGQRVATLRVQTSEQTTVDLPLVALEGVSQAGIVGRAWDSIRLWLR
jgi:D-alanyl-D-alanine carboxypeptidase (penicillin-binding protein 5/6)